MNQIPAMRREMAPATISLPLKMVPDTMFHRETIVDRFFSGGSPIGGRVGSPEGGGSSTGGSSWDGGSLTGGRLRRGSLIGVFFRLFICSKTLLSKIETSRSTLAQSRWPIQSDDADCPLRFRYD
jgi:hypothetical protein